jgi:DNA-binding Lrp family transcriptional regulator
MSNPPKRVSPLEAIDLAYDYPLELPEHLRATLALLARSYPEIRPSREKLALRLGVQVDAVTKRLRELTTRGLITTITVGARERTRAYRILHLPGLPLTIPPAIPDDHPTAERLRIIEARAEGCAHAAGSLPAFVLAQRYRIESMDKPSVRSIALVS